MAKPEQGVPPSEQASERTLTPLERIRRAKEIVAARQATKEGEDVVTEEKAAAKEKAEKGAAEFSKRLGEVFTEAGALELLTRFVERHPDHPETPIILDKLEVFADLVNLGPKEWQEKYGSQGKEEMLGKAQTVLRDEKLVDHLKKQLGEEKFGRLQKDITKI